MKELDGKLVLITERLLVRRWMPDDLEPLLRIYVDVEAMRWVGDGVALTPQQAANWLEVTANNYRQRGYGMYTVALRDGGSVIGFCGLVQIIATVAPDNAASRRVLSKAGMTLIDTRAEDDGSQSLLMSCHPPAVAMQ